MNEVQQYLIGRVLDAVSAYSFCLNNAVNDTPKAREESKKINDAALDHVLECWFELNKHEEKWHNNCNFKNLCTQFPDSFHD